MGKENRRLSEYLDLREVHDVLEDFPSHTLSWQHILSCLKSLQPRYYSIASSPKVVGDVIACLNTMWLMDCKLRMALSIQTCMFCTI